MLSELLKYSSITHAELSRTLNLDKGRLTRFLQCKYYQPRVFYDKIYDILEGKNGKVPRSEKVQLYPSGKAKGAWDVYSKENFVATLVFVNINDVLDFVTNEERYNKVLDLMVTETKFDNNVKIR